MVGNIQNYWITKDEKLVDIFGSSEEIKEFQSEALRVSLKPLAYIYIMYVKLIYSCYSYSMSIHYGSMIFTKNCTQKYLWPEFSLFLTGNKIQPMLS